MTIQDAVQRLGDAAGSTLPASDLRAMAKDIFGKDGLRQLDRLLHEAGYWVIASGRVSAMEFPPTMVNRIRRDYSGPLDPARVTWTETPLSVTVEDGEQRMILAPSGAVPTVIHWLGEQMAPPPVDTPSEPVSAA